MRLKYWFLDININILKYWYRYWYWFCFLGDIDLDIDIGIKKNIDLDIDLDLDFLGGKLLISILILKFLFGKILILILIQNLILSHLCCRVTYFNFSTFPFAINYVTLAPWWHQSSRLRRSRKDAPLGTIPHFLCWPKLLSYLFYQTANFARGQAMLGCIKSAVW